MRFSSISNNKIHHFNNHLPQRRWPSCKQPMIITNNSVSSNSCNKIIERTKPCFTNSTSQFTSMFSDSQDYYNNGLLEDESLEDIIRGVKSSSSERLFFQPQQTKSISRSENKCEGDKLAFKESVSVVMDSKDPYGDFKKSMQEMIESSQSQSQSDGLNNLEYLEKLLEWYMMMNDKRHHELIIEAFVDMFIEFAASSSSSHSSSSVFSAGHL